MEVRWSMPAAEDLEHICEWIERDNSEAARRVARTIYDECARLKDCPNLGRPSRRMAGRRELTFAPLPYITALAGCVGNALGYMLDHPGKALQG